MRKEKLPHLVQLAIFTFITTFVWVSFEIYRAFTKPAPVDVPTEVLQQLNPTLDQVTLDRLVNRIYLEDSEIGDTVIVNDLDFQQIEEESPVEEQESQADSVEEQDQVDIPTDTTVDQTATESAQN